MRPPGTTGTHSEPPSTQKTAPKVQQTVGRYRLKVSETAVFGEKQYVNKKGNTECVEFVRQATGAPNTREWRRGLKVSEAAKGVIPRGTAIATFDAAGRYPDDKDTQGKHAAIYLEHDDKGIQVLDQWNKLGKVGKRTIRFSRSAGTSRSDNGDTFYVID